MNRSRWLLTLWLAGCLSAAQTAQAQQNAPHLAYVLPAGGQPGTVFQIKVGGQFLTNVTDVFVSGGGFQAAVIDYARPMTPMQAMELRDRMQELQKQPLDAAVQKEMTDIRVKLLLFNNSRNISPVLAETVTLQITMASDAEPGERELRLATPQGLSNPLVFCVGQLPEFSEKESINVGTQPGANQPQISQPPTDMNITLPATVNGRIKPGLARPQVPPRPGQQFTPGDVDRYRFQARKGQQLVVIVQRPRADPVSGRRRSRLVSGDPGALRQQRKRAGVCRRLPFPSRSRSPLCGPRGRRVLDRDQGCALPRPRGFRLSHHARRTAVCDEHLSAGRPCRTPSRRSSFGAGTSRQTS